MKKKNSLKLKIYDIVCDAVEAGVAQGYRRVHKYDDDPSEEDLIDSIVSGVMDSMVEVVDFEDQ